MAAPPKQVALVTGGSRGIGLGIAEEFAESGFDLAINGRRASEEVETVVDDLRRRGNQARYFRADIADATSRREMVQAVVETYGRIDVLVNNAGVAPKVRADILEASEESFQRLIGINLQGPYFLTQLVARQMIDQPRTDTLTRGVIINISSVSATIASVNRGDYCISKAGLAMMTKLWATRLAEFEIPVYEVRPGIIRSDMTAPVTDQYDRLIADGLTLEPRWGTPQDVGRAVAALARGILTYATGNVLTIDGGLSVSRL